MTPFAWEHWVERYEKRGFTVLTPGYPGIGQGEAGLKELRDNPDVVAGVGVREIMDYMTDYITKLDSAPVIMGHSFGGTFAQLLVGNGLGAAGVSIDGAAVKGINVQPLSEIRSVLPALDDDRAPLLFISGGSDHILPPIIQRHNYKKNAKHSTAIAAHKVFPGRDHFTCGNPAGKPSPTSPWTGPSPRSRASLTNQRRRPAAGRPAAGR